MTYVAPKNTDITPKYNSSENKKYLFGKQQGRCNGCLYFLHYHVLTVDHIVPQSKGGGDELENLQLLCHSCNSTKGNRTQEEMIAALIDKKIRRND